MQSFDWAKIELVGYQKGILSVRFDFAKSVLIWKDSKRISNNFVRGLPSAQLIPLKQSLEQLLSSCLAQQNEVTDDTEMLQADSNAGLSFTNTMIPEDKAEAMTIPFIWYVVIGQGSHKQHSVSGHDIKMPEWRRVVREIEFVGKRSFRF